MGLATAMSTHPTILLMALLQPTKVPRYQNLTAWHAIGIRALSRMPLHRTRNGHTLALLPSTAEAGTCH